MTSGVYCRTCGEEMAGDGSQVVLHCPGATDYDSHEPDAAPVHCVDHERSGVSDAEIREIFLKAGFSIKEGQDDLKPYVYEAARALIDHMQDYWVREAEGSLGSEDGYGFRDGGSPPNSVLYHLMAVHHLNLCRGHALRSIIDFGRLVWKHAASAGATTELDAERWRAFRKCVATNDMGFLERVQEYVQSAGYGPDHSEGDDHEIPEHIIDAANDAARGEWCSTMERLKKDCGCPDCGSSLIDFPEGS